jgi:hypothetical protein
VGGGARSLEHFCNSIRLSQIERVEDQCHQSQENSDTGNEESEIIVGHRLAGECAIVNRREVWP